MRIALIAMSGVRAFKQELTELGMSLPGFAERERTISSLPSLALLTLAGMTPERVRTTAKVHLEKVGDGFSITKIELVTEAQIPGIDPGDPRQDEP